MTCASCGRRGERVLDEERFRQHVAQLRRELLIDGDYAVVAVDEETQLVTLREAASGRTYQKCGFCLERDGREEG